MAFFLTDHIGSVRTIIDGNGSVKERNDYYPFGARHMKSDYPQLADNRNKFSEKEIQVTGDLDYLDFGKRMYDSELARWFNIDPQAEQYLSLTPYHYSANNPIYYTDKNGEELWITVPTGFLGLGNGIRLRYDWGVLYNEDGSIYTGKIKGFLKNTIDALGEIGSVIEGGTLVEELVNSDNIYTIKRNSKNSFTPDSKRLAGGAVDEILNVTGGTYNNSGSGGLIKWDPNSRSSGIDINGGTSRPSYIGLAHEMAHASDANQGMLYPTSDYTNIANKTYSSTFFGVLKVEWRAVYQENTIRAKKQIPLRAFYGIDLSTGTIKPIGNTRLLDSNNKPINYPRR